MKTNDEQSKKDLALREMDDEILRLRGQERALRELIFHINYNRDMIFRNIEGLLRERRSLIETDVAMDSFHRNLP